MPVKFPEYKNFNKNRYNVIKKDITGVNVHETGNEKRNKTLTKNVLYISGGLAGAAIASYLLIKRKMPKNEFIKTLAHDLSQYLNKDIKPISLKSVMTQEEFLSEISKLKKENFVASPENIKNGIFCADLHSHTVHSDGNASVADILDGVVKYADELFSKTKKKFIYAITDHDGMEGVKKALAIISDNPQKFKNVKFVTGIELSFVRECEKGSQKFARFHNNTECAELLAFCVNPFSKNVENYFSSLKLKRQNTINAAFQEISAKYKNLNLSTSEADEIVFNGKENTGLYNLHWRIHNYVQLKNRIVEMSQEQNKPIEHFINIIKENKITTPYDFDKYLIHNSILTKTQTSNSALDEICKKYFPKIQDNKILTNSENTFEDIINSFSKEKDVVMGFAHPAFLLENIAPNNFSDEINKYITQSNGMLKLSEKYHQAYTNAIEHGEMNTEFIGKANEITDKFNLIPIGGRDNHTKNFLDDF